MPDPSTGVVDGKPAMLGWPAELRPDGAPGALLSPSACDVHLALFNEPEREFLFPCGRWFLPQPNRYWMWLEQGETISGQSQLLATGASGSVGQRNIYPMVPAGYVSIDVPLSGDQAARLINLKPEYRAFQKSVPENMTAKPTRMPAGRIAGGIFERRSGNAVAFFQPFELGAGQRAHVALIRQTGAGVFVVLKAPPVPRGRIGLALHVNGSAIPPDDMVDGGTRLYAFWYSVRGTKAKLEVINNTVMYDGPELVLRNGTVTTRRDEMKLRSR